MTESKDVFFENFLFRFDGLRCDCVEDIIHIAPGVEPNVTFKFHSLSGQKITFAYAAKKGLVRIAPNGTIEEENILGTLIALPNKPDKNIKDFFKNNGFIFPVSSSSYEDFDKQLTLSIIDRLRLTVELMTAANEIHKDYSKIFIMMVQLLSAKDISVNSELMEKEYKSCHHPYFELLINPPTTLSYKRQQEEFDGNIFNINDSIYGTYAFSISEYNEIIGGCSQIPGFKEPLFKNIVAMYVNYEGSPLERKITDLLFHYLYEVGIICTSQGFAYYESPKMQNLTQELKDALIEISNYIVGKEINANLEGIHPIYDSTNMMPSWKVDSLLCAAYFSIFYLKPDLELYRPCANPRCGKYFLVKTTSTRKKYCSTECCNRVSQDKYRKNNRSKKE